MNFLSFLIRWKVISRHHKRLGSWYFRSFFLAIIFFLIGIGLAIVSDKPGSNQEYYLLGFYSCMAL